MIGGDVQHLPCDLVTRPKNPSRQEDMESLLTKYCRQYSCRPEDFERQIFFQCLHLSAWPLYLFLGGRRSAYFDCDRRLIARIAHASSVEQVREELGDFFAEPENRSWLRKDVRVRLSTSKLLDLSKKIFPSCVSRAQGKSGARLSAD